MIKIHLSKVQESTIKESHLRWGEDYLKDKINKALKSNFFSDNKWEYYFFKEFLKPNVNRFLVEKNLKIFIKEYENNKPFLNKIDFIRKNILNAQKNVNNKNITSTLISIQNVKREIKNKKLLFFIELLENDFKIDEKAYVRANALKKHKTNINKWYDKLIEFEKNRKKNRKKIENILELYSKGSDIKSGLDNLKKNNSSKQIKKIITEISNGVEIIKNLNSLYFLWSSFHQKMICIFDYLKFSQEGTGWNRHKFMTLLDVRVCPYCQRNYITKYSENQVEKTTGDLDHFYCQSKYPFLALNIWNFVPSCQICNRNFKRSKDAYKNEMVYPYEEGFDDYNVKFTTSARGSLRFLLGLPHDKLEIKFNNDSSDKVNNNLKAFKLKEIYKESHSKYLYEIITQMHREKEGYIKSISKIFNTAIAIDNTAKIKDLVLLSYKIKINQNEPLSKLIKDIFEEFKIL